MNHTNGQQVYRNDTVPNHQVNTSQKHNEVLINKLISHIKYLKINEENISRTWGGASTACRNVICCSHYEK